MSIYQFQKFCNASQLSREVETTSFSNVLLYVSTDSAETIIHFNRDLTNSELEQLQNLVSNHIPTEELESNEIIKVEVEQPKDTFGRPIFTGSPFSDAGGFRFRGASFKGTIAANSTQNVDYKIEQERWINGGRALIDNIGEDDKITFQVVDKDNIFGYGNEVVLDEFISNYYIPTDGNLEVRLSYPAKVPAGLYLRLKYTSTHENGCTLKCNLYLHWKAQ